MGNREALLEGAKRCLLDKGYARTTARDIATASGVSLAAIGYHYGTKDVLLEAALLQATEEWGERLEAALSGELDPDMDVEARAEAVWTRVLASFDGDRAFWRASFELIAHGDQTPQARKLLAEVQDEARRGLASIFLGIDEADPRAPVLGAVYQAMLTGLVGLMLVDPEQVPRPRELARAMMQLSAA